MSYIMQAFKYKKNRGNLTLFCIKYYDICYLYSIINKIFRFEGRLNYGRFESSLS